MAWVFYRTSSGRAAVESVGWTKSDCIDRVKKAHDFVSLELSEVEKRGIVVYKIVENGVTFHRAFHCFLYETAKTFEDLVHLCAGKPYVYRHGDYNYCTACVSEFVNEKLGGDIPHPELQWGIPRYRVCECQHKTCFDTIKWFFKRIFSRRGLK